MEFVVANGATTLSITTFSLSCKIQLEDTQLIGPICNAQNYYTQHYDMLSVPFITVVIIVFMLSVVAHKQTHWNTALKNCKQLFEYQHLLLLREIRWLKL